MYKLLILIVSVMVLNLCGCVSSQQPNLRVGIVSDTQSYPGKNEHSGPVNLRKALNILKDKQIDVLLYAGDVADNGNKQVYVEAREIMTEVFGDNPPEEIIIMGNHDYWNDMPTEEAQKNFTDNIKQDSINTHKVINGYTFVGISPENGALFGTYTDEISGKFLNEAVAQATQNDPSKPIFVITHQQAKDTIYGSDDWGNADLYRLLKPYENVVLFSGHAHYAMEDERSIHQRDFTSVATSSLAYCEMENGKINGSVPPDAHKSLQILIMDIYDDHLQINRYQVFYDQPIKPNMSWNINIPIKKADFTYTNDRAQNRSCPYFLPEASIDIAFDSEVEFSKGVLKFDSAKHDDFVHSYAIKLYEKSDDGQLKFDQELLYFSDFYLGLPQMKEVCEFSIPADKLKANTKYHVQVFAIESFGKRSLNTLEIDFITPKAKVEPPAKK